jgi:uncharacterized protein YaiI (UPF0178 family)
MRIIYLDADACPVQGEVYRGARRDAMVVKVVVKTPLLVPGESLVEWVVRPD